LVLKKKYPHTHIVYTPENTSQIIIRIYMGSNMIKPTITQTQQSVVMDFMHTLRETVIRGIKDVNYATVIDIARPRIKPDGGISNTTVYGIHTAGSNMESIMNNKYIDAYRSQCDSIIEFQEIYGVAAARNKIIDELTKEIDVNRVHTSVYADEMTFTGEATSIQKSGMQKREMGNVALRLTFQSPIQVSEDASANGYVNKVSGNSGPLVMGGVVQLGTQYNKVIVSTTEVDKLTDNFMKAIDDEL
jgi:DNA-directed RNA polymerase beta' subunit